MTDAEEVERVATVVHDAFRDWFLKMHPDLANLRAEFADLQDFAKEQYRHVARVLIADLAGSAEPTLIVEMK